MSLLQWLSRTREVGMILSQVSSVLVPETQPRAFTLQTIRTLGIFCSVHHMDVNYFVCTLGQAALLASNDNAEYEDINGFIEYQARTNPELLALGFAYPTTETNTANIASYTFGDLLAGSQYVASSLSSTLEHKSCVALLAPSTAEFVFTWLGLIRAGHSVLLLAPQLQPPAIAHLCASCEVTCLYFDREYENLATGAERIKIADGSGLNANFRIQSILFRVSDAEFLDALRKGPADEQSRGVTKSSDVAYLHHTSGTSSGLPKPIPQTHHGAVGILPHTLHASDKATFTTTPMYHGGPADCFRAWTASAMIWLFPGKRCPVTAANICRYLEIANDHGEMCPPVRYFAAVPYVLQMMADNPAGLAQLRRMDAVGVGGASMPEEVGSRLISAGVNLVSRFGSAECGFLMSSHRDYKVDKGWQYLRTDAGAENLSFEARDDGLFELVVMPQWPHRAKTNRSDGSFATADLFSPHPSLKNAWKYHSRADSQLTLVTGKKFDPAPLESSLATSHLVDDALIFGEGRAFPGVLLFRSEAAAELNDIELVEQLAEHVERLNRDSQPHTRLGRNMLRPVAYGQNNLVKSSKGTIMRRKSWEIYEHEINSAYDEVDADLSDTVPNEKVKSIIRSEILELLDKEDELPNDADLFGLGMDSIASIRMRHILQRLIGSSNPEPAMDIVESCGSIDRLSQYVINSRRGITPALDVDGEDIALMHDLVKRYSVFDPPLQDANGSTDSSDDVVLLTGATGALGAHILHILMLSPSVRKIYCLVRGATPTAALERVAKSLESRGLSTVSDKVSVLPCHSSSEDLGIGSSTYSRLVKEVNVVYHAAWAVNFRMHLRSFEKDHIAGLHNIIAFCLKASPSACKFVFCSSTASVARSRSSLVEETISTQPEDASTIGYSRSKWVAEQICSAAHRDTNMHGRIAILRVGQLAGDSVRGVWNMKEAYPAMLASIRLIGKAPELENEELAWLPVDAAAQATIEAAHSLVGDASSTANTESIRVHHVVNPRDPPPWKTALEWLRRRGVDFEAMAVSDWIKELEKYLIDMPHHPAAGLTGHWKALYVSDTGTSKAQFEVSPKTFAAMPSLKSVRAVGEDYFGKLWEWVLGQRLESI